MPSTSSRRRRRLVIAAVALPSAGAAFDGRWSASVVPVNSIPALTATELWQTLQAEASHLRATERLQIRACVDVLLAKISLAERAERASPAALRIGSDCGSSSSFPAASAPSEALHVIAAVRTAKPRACF